MILDLTFRLYFFILAILRFYSPKQLTMFLTCIIIDDEEHALFQLQEAIDAVPELKLLKSFTSVQAAKQWLLENGPVHLVFLDIEMPLIDGLVGVEMLQGRYKRLVYTTAHTEYAAKAFELKAADYLIKPVNPQKLIRCLDKLVEGASLSQEEKLMRVHTRFIANYQGEFRGLATEDIQYILANGDYVTVYTKQGKHTLHIRLQKIYEDLIDLIPITQIHRSTLISLDFLENYFGDTVTMKDGKKLEVGRAYKKAFHNELRFLSYGSKRD